MTFSSNWGIPCQDGFFQFLISSRNFYCSISVWEYVFSPSFRRYFLLRIESFQHGFWCVHLFQLLKVHNQYVSFSNFTRIQDIVEEYSRKYFLSKLMDSRLVFCENRMIFKQGIKWKGWSLKWFFNACVLRTPHQHTRLVRDEQISTHGRFFAFGRARLSWAHPLPAVTFSVTTITDGHAREQFPWLSRGPDCSLSRLLLLELRPAGDPVDSDSSWRRSPP